MFGFNQYSLVSTKERFFCAPTQMLIQMFLDEKAKLNDVKLITLLGPYYVICVYTKVHKKEQVHNKSLLNSVCFFTLVLWFVTGEDS